MKNIYITVEETSLLLKKKPKKPDFFFLGWTAIFYFGGKMLSFLLSFLHVDKLSTNEEESSLLCAAQRH